MTRRDHPSSTPSLHGVHLLVELNGLNLGVGVERAHGILFEGDTVENKSLACSSFMEGDGLCRREEYVREAFDEVVLVLDFTALVAGELLYPGSHRQYTTLFGWFFSWAMCLGFMSSHVFFFFLSKGKGIEAGRGNVLSDVLVGGVVGAGYLCRHAISTQTSNQPPLWGLHDGALTM